MPKQHKSAQGHSFYFVLYLVAIVTVFVITNERDMLLAKRADDMARLVELYVKPLRLTPAIDTVRCYIPAGPAAGAEPVRLLAKTEGPIERGDIQFQLLSVRSHGPGGTVSHDPGAGTVVNDGGNAVVVYPAQGEGIYEFAVAGYKPRIRIKGQTMRLNIRDTSYEIQYSDRLARIDRDTTILLASVTKSGLDPIPLCLSSERAHDTWVLGPSYAKRVFIGGVESPDKVSFDASPFRVERNAQDRSSVTLVWDHPSLGAHTFKASAAAGRGLGQADRASISFSVDILPPTFVNPSADRSFFGIPYAFDGQIVGINPIDLSVETLHDGQSIGTKPVVPKESIVPERSWHTLAFRVLYHGTAVKEHRITVEPPPPPQIKWVQQQLDRSRNAFVINVACSDPAGGPVKMSIESQPSGIARLDKMRGTSFVITVSLDGKPGAVFLKLSAVDQYGGEAKSTKQFNTQ
jgi:hypothetical protein